MKKVTLFLFMLGVFLTANAQYVFTPIAGPTNVVSGSPVTINLNDVANSAGVTASSTGSYDSFSISADWSAGAGNPWSSEANITVTTTAGSVNIDPATSGSANSGVDTTLTFDGDLAGLYDESSDGYLDIVLDQSFAGSDANWSNIVVTLFESATCIDPSGMTVSTITPTSADLNWTVGDTETTWNIEWNSSTDFTPGNGEEEGASSVNTNPSTSLTGLNANTPYFLYYQANCGSGDVSAWVGPVTFSTLCDEFIPDYLEDFTTIIPDCWNEADSGDATTGPGDLGSGAWTADEFLNTGTGDGAYKINLFSDTKSDWIISPVFDLTGGPFQVEFDFAITEWNSSSVAGTLGSDDTVEFLMTTDSGASWITLLTYDSSSVVPISGSHPVIDLTAYSGQTVQFGILGSEGTVNDTEDVDVFVDNFQVRNIPTCAEPTDITITNITSEGGELSWTENGTATLWNVEIVEAGTAVTGTPTESGVSNPYLATGLNAITSYDFYVQADCGGDLSSWTGPYTFTTLCDVFTPDYIENFTTIIPDCWDEADSGDATTGPGDLGAGSWTADEFLNTGTGDGAYKINLFSNTKSDWIISPVFDLTGGPFQVEFDFAITEWNSSSVAGTLGSDDTVEFLITTDSGATWITLLTYDSSSVVPITGTHPVIDLSAYSGQTVQFGILGSEGTVNDTEDVDVFVDNFQVRNIPSCLEPTDLSATNLSLTSTEVSWTEAGSSTSWNIEYGIEGFTQGSGTVEADVTTNPFVITGLSSDTSYEFYVQAICGPSNLSSWTGPFQFYTGYCTSEPTSNDGQGVSNVTIGVTDFPSFGDVTYENHTTPAVNVFQGVDTNVAITFATGFTYNTNIWIDFNDDLVFDASELVYQGESTNANPTTLDASFTMPVAAPIGEHRMRIGTADTGQATPNPCYSGSWGVTLDFTVNIQVLTCTLPEADYTIVTDCDNDQFAVDVNVTSLGDATSLEISNSLDATTVQATAIGTYQAGPFPFGSTVKIFVTNEQDNNCVISSSFFEVLACPPSNDECETATVAVVNDGDLCNELTSGTILAATPSGIGAGSCSGTPNDDVWFEFTALSEVQIISILNISGGTTNLDHAIYEGSCGSITELYCSTSTSSVTPALTVGGNYYVRVFSGGSQSETTSFDLCIREAPTNIICENAENFCSVGGALINSNIVGIPDPNDIACLGSAPNPTWNIIQIGESGVIEIEINQVDDAGNGLDVDFVIWGPFNSVPDACDNIAFEDCPTCPFSNNPDTGFYPFGNIIDCSYSAAPIENLTIDNALEDEVYMLLVTNFSDDPGTITITQTNAGNTDSGTIEAEITAEIVSNEVVFEDTDSDPSTPAEANVCGFNSVTIEVDSPFADEYVWYKNGFVMEGETSATLTVTESDSYQVQVFDDQCAAEAFSQVVIINLYNDPGTFEIMSFAVCDSDSGSGEEFDLDEFTATLNLDSQLAISYYTNTDDANQAINPVTSPYVSSGETLVVRIEDVDAANNGYLGCRSLTELDLVVGPELCIFPQGISPGVSPGFNDFFDLSNFDVTRLEIFNRNGTLVYSKDNYTNEWVGQSNDGEELPVGTYFYTMVYDGGAKQRSAWIYINR